MATNLTEERLLTVQEVARWLQISPRTVLLRIEDGTIAAIRIGGVWRIRESCLASLVESTGTPRG